MNKFKKIASLVILSGFVASPLYAAKDTTVDMSKVSYVIGYEIGNGFKQQNIEISPNVFLNALNTGISGNQSKYSKEDMEKTMQAFQKEMMEKALAKRTEVAKKNKVASTTYIDNVKKMAGVKEVKNGVYYKVIEKPKTESLQIPSENDKVTVNYQGSLSDGKIFDSSYLRKKAVTFGVNQVIPCWQAALTKMPVGATWEIYCSAEQGYGEYAPESIGPNQALIFKVHLIKINKTKVDESKSATKKLQTKSLPQTPKTDSNT